MELCHICKEGMEETLKYTLTPCNHVYHGACIINWLCEHRGTCYECREEYRRELRELQERRPQYRNFKYASSQARRKTASKALKTLYAKYKRLNLKYKENMGRIKRFNTEKMPILRKLRKEYYSMRCAKRKLYRSMNRIRNNICKLFPITEPEIEPSRTELYQ